MRPDVGGRFFHEKVTSIPARIASLKIAEGTERLPALGNHCYGGHRHGHINNGFRVEAGHGSAAYMLDIQHEMPDVLVKKVAFLVEQIVPVRPVSDNLYSPSFQADPIPSLKANVKDLIRLAALRNNCQKLGPSSPQGV